MLNGKLKCSGIKRGKNGVGIVLIEGRIFAVYTKNRIKSAPILFNLKNLGKKVRGIIVNSGNANAFTGKAGLENVERIAEFLAKKIECDVSEIAVASTGVIGIQLDVAEIERLADEAFRNLGEGEEAIKSFAKAIMTTDSFPKISRRVFDGVEILGIAKGAGMISPNMATMLAFIFTNAKIEEMDRIFREAVNISFNRLIVDGDMSTNDTVFLVTTDEVEVDTEKFSESLKSLMLELAEMIARDGEGATKVFWVRVEGARNDDDAQKVARAVARSNLVKTAIFGGDPNFGRIVCAVGYSGAEVDENLTIKIGSEKGEVVIVARGGVIEENLEKAREIMEADKLEIAINLHKGDGVGYAIGCDLTFDYVELNSKYTT